jgi:hypothetical protein
LIGPHQLAGARDLLAPRVRHLELSLNRLARFDEHPMEAATHKAQLAAPMPRILARNSGAARIFRIALPPGDKLAA